MATETNRRWALVNRKTGKTRRAVKTRDDARWYKTANERIFDVVNQRFVR